MVKSLEAGLRNASRLGQLFAAFTLLAAIAGRGLATEPGTVAIGLDSLWKVGFETPASIRAGSDWPADAQVQIVAVDSDGVGVAYERSAPDRVDFQLPVRHGRISRPTRLRVWASDRSEVLVDRELSVAERGTGMPIDQPWVIAAGGSLALQAITQESALGGLPTVSISRFDSPAGLPVAAEFYGGVDLLVLSTLDVGFIRDIEPDQAAAIQRWVAAGGRLQIWIGANAEEIAEIDWLADLIPGEIVGVERGVNPALLESYLSASPLADLTAAVIEPRGAKVDLRLLGRQRREIPLLMHAAYGSGMVDVVATDVDGEALMAWSDRDLLLRRIVPVAARPPSAAGVSRSLAGYTDLMGQIRSSLDLFEGVSIYSISSLVLLATGFLLVIGPLDWAIHRRGIARSKASWLVLLGATVGMLWLVSAMAAAGKPPGSIVNALEFVDISLARGRMSGQAFLHQYSGEARRFDVSARLATEPFATGSGPADAGQGVYLRWAGQPGSGLGGFDSTVLIDNGLPEYRVQQQLSGGEIVDSQVLGIGIPAASTVAYRSSWSREVGDLSTASGLQNHPGSDFLEGTFTNPLSTALLNPLLAYETWGYVLPERIEPGETVRLSINDIPRSLFRELQRMEIVNDREQSVPWNPQSRRELPRLAQLATFYEEAGGRKFVGLDLEYLATLDLSRQLKLGRAVLFAELESGPMVRLNVESAGADVPIIDGLRQSFVRFIIPVTDR